MTKLIRGGTVVNHDHSRRADVLIKDGVVVAIGENLEAPAGAEVIDAGGCYVMPGGIDPHTHLEFMFMGTVTADDFEWGTKAALSGGTTMVVDFCIPNPGQSMLAAYQDWRRKAEGAACDYGFHMAVTSWNKQVFDEMETVVKTYGINTFKHFMAYKGALMVNDDELYNSFLRCAGLGAMPLVHAENGDVIWHLQQHYLGTGLTGPEGHAYSRPPAVEGEAANRAIMIADMAGCGGVDFKKIADRDSNLKKVRFGELYGLTSETSRGSGSAISGSRKHSIVGRMEADFDFCPTSWQPSRRNLLTAGRYNENHPSVPSRLLRLDSPLAEPRGHI